MICTDLSNFNSFYGWELLLFCPYLKSYKVGTVHTGIPTHKIYNMLSLENKYSYDSEEVIFLWLILIQNLIPPKRGYL